MSAWLSLAVALNFFVLTYGRRAFDVPISRSGFYTKFSHADKELLTHLGSRIVPMLLKTHSNRPRALRKKYELSWNSRPVKLQYQDHNHYHAHSQQWPSPLSSQPSGLASRQRPPIPNAAPTAASSPLTQTPSSPSTTGSQATATKSSRADWSRRRRRDIGLSIVLRRRLLGRIGRGVRSVVLW